MNRSIDMMRYLLTRVVEDFGGKPYFIFKIDGYGGTQLDKRVRYHFELLYDAGYIMVLNTNSEGYQCKITDSGYKFYEIIKDKKVYAEAKKMCKQKGEFNIGMLRLTIKYLRKKQQTEVSNETT